MIDEREKKIINNNDERLYFLLQIYILLKQIFPLIMQADSALQLEKKIQCLPTPVSR